MSMLLLVASGWLLRFQKLLVDFLFLAGLPGFSGTLLGLFLRVFVGLCCLL